MKYGYARVSTDGQSVDAQVRQLAKAGCKKVFREVASGAKTDRAQLRKAIATLGAGDVLMVTRLDRLARSTRDLLNMLAAITDRKAGFRSLGDTWADTTTSHGRLMLTVLGGLAEFERDLIRTRTGDGRARAVARGQKMGRPPLGREARARLERLESKVDHLLRTRGGAGGNEGSPCREAEELQKWQKRHSLTQVAAAKALGMPIQTYRNWLKGRYPISPMAEKLCAYIDRFDL